MEKSLSGLYIEKKKMGLCVPFIWLNTIKSMKYYLDDAIDLVKSLAGIRDAQVIQYKRPFSLGSLLGVESKANIFKLDKNMLYELGTPQTLYLWSAY